MDVLELCSGCTKAFSVDGSYLWQSQALQWVPFLGCDGMIPVSQVYQGAGEHKCMMDIYSVHNRIQSNEDIDQEVP